MSALVEGYESSDDEVQPQTVAQSVPAVEDDESDDEEKLEAQARIDAFGLKDGNGNTQARKKDGKLVVASAPDVLREVRISLPLLIETDGQDPNHVSSAIIARPTDKVINVNITYDDMTRPVAGPQDPFNNQKNRGMNSISGTSCQSRQFTLVTDIQGT